MDLLADISQMSLVKCRLKFNGKRMFKEQKCAKNQPFLCGLIHGVFNKMRATLVGETAQSSETLSFHSFKDYNLAD